MRRRTEKDLIYDSWYYSFVGPRYGICFFNEETGWSLANPLKFSRFHRNYKNGNNTLQGLVDFVEDECQIDKEDDSTWAENIRMLIRDMILNYEKYFRRCPEPEDDRLDRRSQADKFLSSDVFCRALLSREQAATYAEDITRDVALTLKQHRRRIWKRWMRAKSRRICRNLVVYTLAAAIIVGACFLLFSFIGVSVFLLPLIGGAFTQK